MLDNAYAVTFFGALFAIMNPFVNLPVFLSLTDGMDPARRRACAIRVALYTAAMCAAMALGGHAALGFFGISLDAFRAAGGLVLGVIGLHLLNGAESASHHGSPSEKSAQAAAQGDIAFYPMTFPMLVGPGTIATLILFMSRAKDVTDHIAFAAVVAVIIAALAAVLLAADVIGRHLTQTLRTVTTRLMGMILLAIAVEMSVAGLKALWVA